MTVRKATAREILGGKAAIQTAKPIHRLLKPKGDDASHAQESHSKRN